MLRTVLVLCGFQLLGESLAALLSLPVPGPVIGMCLLLVVLIIRRRVTPQFQQHSHALFAYLPLILVPPSVGVLAHLELISRDWQPVVGVLSITLIISLLICAAVYRISRERWS